MKPLSSQGVPNQTRSNIQLHLQEPIQKYVTGEGKQEGSFKK